MFGSVISSDINYEYLTITYVVPIIDKLHQNTKSQSEADTLTKDQIGTTLSSPSVFTSQSHAVWL